VDQLILSPQAYERFLAGAQTTVLLLLIAFALGVVLSVVVGVMRLSNNVVVRGVALVFVELARGISSVILIFLMAIALPIFLGLDQGNLIALGAFALGINMGGYGAEIIRGAILSVPKGQTEASIALNLSEYQRLRHIILPQAMRVILPPMGNLTIEILKGTAIISTVGVADLTAQIGLINTSQAAAGAAGERIPYLMIAANALLMYFILAQLIAFLFRMAERYVEGRYEGSGGRSSGPPSGGASGKAEATA
jgi:polar amino acid transport system permease protein